MIWFQTNFRCYVHPHVNSGECCITIGFHLHLFSLKLIKRKFHPSGRGFCLGCRSYLAGPTRRGSVDRKCCMGIQRLSSHPLWGWIRTNPWVCFFRLSFCFFLGCFTLNDAFNGKMCWLDSGKKCKTEQDRPWEELQFKEFFWNTFNGWKLNIQGKGEWSLYQTWHSH